MKAKTLIVLVIVALLCTSIASAGFVDWITGKVSLNFLKRAKTDAAKAPAAVSTKEVSPAAADKVQPVEWDTSVKAYKGDALLVHTENTLRQLEATLGLVAKKWDTKPAEWDSSPAGVAQ
ncbi:MAG TPA: hypothetical protein HA362_03580 [Nanoarchaeota archaeon]|nr:hypothetical protein [Nanoarchaeota archaeon]